MTPTKIVVTIILLAAIVFPLLTWTYARDTPRLFGFPFFYWYQFIWVFLAAGACYLCYVLLRRESRGFESGQHNTRPTAPPGEGAHGESADQSLHDHSDAQRKAE